MIRELSPELAKIAREELNENPKQIGGDLQHLKEWISKQPHLRARTDDQWLIVMLRGSKFSLERVKQKLDLYYTLRTTAPDFTLRIRPTDSKFIDFFRLGTCTVLPKPKVQLYPRVVLLRVGLFDPAVHHVGDIMCMLYYTVQLLVLEDDVASVLGIKIVVDYTGVTMNHFMQATPTVCKKMIDVCQNSMPLRLKGSHHVNMPSGIEKIISIVSVFLNEKAKQRTKRKHQLGMEYGVQSLLASDFSISGRGDHTGSLLRGLAGSLTHVFTFTAEKVVLKIHKDGNEIIEHIPKEIVPQEYGGDGGTVADIIEYWVSKIRESQDWMRYEEQLGTDESKRPGPPIHTDLMEDGSFRKLDID